MQNCRWQLDNDKEATGLWSPVFIDLCLTYPYEIFVNFVFKHIRTTFSHNFYTISSNLIHNLFHSFIILPSSMLFRHKNTNHSTYINKGIKLFTRT